jgi:hypothetical protein
MAPVPRSNSTDYYSRHTYSVTMDTTANERKMLNSILNYDGICDLTHARLKY